MNWDPSTCPVCPVGNNSLLGGLSSHYNWIWATWVCKRNLMICSMYCWYVCIIICKPLQNTGKKIRYFSKRHQTQAFCRKIWKNITQKDMYVIINVLGNHLWQQNTQSRLDIFERKILNVNTFSGHDKQEKKYVWR